MAADNNTQFLLDVEFQGVKDKQGRQKSVDYNHQLIAAGRTDVASLWIWISHCKLISLRRADHLAVSLFITVRDLRRSGFKKPSPRQDSSKRCV